MAAVPQRTLNWLYSILIRDHYDPKQTYQDPNRAYYDVANALAQYPSLSPRTDVYTYETGFSTLLLLLAGTVPVSFRGNLYKFPIEVWIPTNYPCEPPMVYVTPTQDMVVRAGQHVTLEGRVYHHYLAHWMEAWDRATLVEFLSILRDVFATEPPVKYKPAPQPQALSIPTPPPVPPLPPGFGSTSSPAMASPPAGPPAGSPAGPPAPEHSAPGPPPPPKPGQAERQTGYSSPPPLPPLPREELERRSITRGPPHVYRHSWNQQQQPPPNQYQTYQVQPGPQPGQPTRVPQSQPGPARPPVPHSQPVPGPVPGPAQPPSTVSGQPIATAAPAQPTQPTKPEQQTDLLTSPFDVDLPTFHPPSSALPPPIPPNPEKHALQSAVSKAVSETLLSNTSQSASAAHALSAQSHSLRVAIAAVQAEIASLNGLNSALHDNTSILKDSLQRADGVISDANCRLSSINPAPIATPSSSTSTPGPTPGPAGAAGVGTEGGLPPIDEILVAPTVVGKQLYDLTAEEAGIQQAIYALQGALVKGVIGPETWARYTRGLAREAFLKRALGRKVAVGLGLGLDF